MGYKCLCLTLQTARKRSLGDLQSEISYSFSCVMVRFALFCLWNETKMGLSIWVSLLLLLPIICCSACLVEERNSLLDVKQGINFTYYRGFQLPLESWRGFNCCTWQGVGCHPRTGHVITLDLSSSYEKDVGFVWNEIREGLFQLLYLEYLDLSGNSFHSLSIPPQVGQLRRLKYLSLYYCHFSGRIPIELSKLQQLEHLDLSYNHFDGAIPREMGSMSTLKFLDLSAIDSLQSGNMSEWITHLRGLEHLGLSGMNLTMEGDIWLGIIASLANLTKFSMNNCGLSGEIPPSFANLSGLQWLDLSRNSLRGKIPVCLGALPLSNLYLSYNNLEGPLPSSLGGLSKVQYLDLSSNKLNGSIPYTLGNLSSLFWLELQDNSLSGPIPTSFANLSRVNRINLANNYLNGTFSFYILNSCSHLEVLDLSSNMLTVEFTPSTIPKFQLTHLDLRDSNISGIFPGFISTQYSIIYLDLSNNSLSGFIPNWLWELPDLAFLDLSNNFFEGPILKTFSRYTNYFGFLSLAKNNITGFIPNSICNVVSLEILDLSNNRFSGRIPQCLENCSMLSLVNLENNNLEGMIPNIFESMNYSLETLKLGDNMLEGNIPLSLGKCGALKILDIRNNKLQGSIANWVKSLHSLQILVLKNNKFKGKIPLQLTKLQNLQILDISNNLFSGVIPSDFMKLTTMTNQSDNAEIFEQSFFLSMIASEGAVQYIDGIRVMNKGQNMEFRQILRLVKCLDLSNNNLSGKIPWNIGSLKGLVILNISRNHFNGEIPKSIREMVLLQSLDLSHNNLSGVIPTELQLLTSLSYFDVSSNNLSGMIPQGGQMMTFDSTYFSNNSGLCGLQIYAPCLSSHPNSLREPEENNEDAEDDIWWDMGMATGCVISFSIVMGILWINKTWSIICFKFMDAIINFLFQTLRE